MSLSNSLGYCCICNTLRDQKPSVFTGRSIIKRTFTESLRDERAYLNCCDLLPILQWNEQHDIRVFRFGSDFFPRATCPEFGYDILRLPQIDLIRAELKRCGDFAIKHGHHLSSHPGQFNVLCSDKPHVVDNTIRELEMHSLVCDLIDPYDRLDMPINIHMGAGFSLDACDRFVAAYDRLSPKLRSRLVVENDDKRGSYSTKQLYDHVYSRCGIPITFDFHHHAIHPDGLSAYDAFQLALSTWGDNRSCQVHYSQSPTADKLIPKHSDYYRDPLPSWLDNYADRIHCHLECKSKELGLLDYRQKFCKEKKMIA